MIVGNGEMSVALGETLGEFTRPVEGEYVVAIGLFG